MQHRSKSHEVGRSYRRFWDESYERFDQYIHDLQAKEQTQ